MRLFDRYLFLQCDRGAKTGRAALVALFASPQTATHFPYIKTAATLGFAHTAG
jgi:hypothetical protein